MRRALPVVLATVLPLLAFVSGCATGRVAQRQTLHLLIVPTVWMDSLRQESIHDGRLMQPLLKAFRRLQPNVAVQISIQSHEGLERRLRVSGSQGLAPDLMLMRAPQAVDLLQKKLIDPLPSGDPAVARVLGHIQPLDLSRVMEPAGIAGLPLLSEFTLACYDRTRLQQPPTTLSDLLAVAASGRSVGLSVDPTGLWWTAGALGAQPVMTPILIGGQAGTPEPTAEQRRRLRGWLVWLRQAALQSRVEIENGPQALIEGLESGRLSWVPCFSMALLRLDRTMGDRLGVAPLPGGPDGPPSPFSTTRVWALGRDSSSEQRRLALQLAALSLDPLIQRQMMLQGRMFMPANRFVPIPVSSSGRLGTLAIAERQFEQSSPLLAHPFSIARLDRLMPRMESTLLDVMVGVISPEQGVEGLLRLSTESAEGR